jgi:hypothetical protein
LIGFGQVAALVGSNWENPAATARNGDADLRGIHELVRTVYAGFGELIPPDLDRELKHSATPLESREAILRLL